MSPRPKRRRPLLRWMGGKARTECLWLNPAAVARMHAPRLALEAAE